MAKILIVDDEQINITLLEKRLCRCGYEVEKAFNGKEALNLIEKQEFDAILLDIMMPEMDGFELARILKKTPGLQQIPIIFLSAKTSIEDKIEGLSIGAADYITKPFDFRELEARLKIILISNKEKNEIKKEAYIDFLTGIFNRRYIDGVLKSEFDEDNLCSLLMLDLDYFKRINDTYGHDQGDIVLKEVAKIIVQVISSDGIVGRFGGEEFIVILPKISNKTAVNLAEKIRLNVEQSTFILNEKKEYMTISIGVCTYCREEELFYSIEDFIKAADYALYKAKNSGRNRIYNY